MTTRAPRSVAVSSVSQIAADAGARAASEGGNAVDAAIAAALVSMVTEPGVVSFTAGAFLTIWPDSGAPIAVEGAGEMPGRGLPPDAFGQAGNVVCCEYGGGMETMVGYGTVGTPGGLAAMALASRHLGRVPWRMLMEPAYEHARNGFALSSSAHRYLAHTQESILGWNPPAVAPLLDANGALKGPGDTVQMEELADSLETIAHDGVDEFYRGEIGRLIAEDVTAHGGILTRSDLEAYEARIAPALCIDLDGWTIATSPPPSVGGTTLAAMLLQLRGASDTRYADERLLRKLIDVQELVLEYRLEHLDHADNLPVEAARLLNAAGRNALRRAVNAGGTVHTSTVDSSGLACSVTASAGYGSGVMPPGTGMWMNNCLGELELNKRGYHAWRPGDRLPSNMAPSVGRGPGATLLAIGSPGADRITSAILQTLLGFIHLKLSLGDAVARPRLHVEHVDGRNRVAWEPGLGVDRLDVPQRRFDEFSMFFGGVSAALYTKGAGFVVAADPRRVGGTAVT